MAEYPYQVLNVLGRKKCKNACHKIPSASTALVRPVVCLAIPHQLISSFTLQLRLLPRFVISLKNFGTIDLLHGLYTFCTELHVCEITVLCNLYCVVDELQ